MTRRLLWNAGLAAVVLVGLGWLFDHLTTASLDGALRQVQGPPAAPVSYARPCVDPGELIPATPLQPARPSVTIPPRSPFEQAEILGAAVWYVQRQPDHFVSLAIAAPAAFLQPMPTDIVIDRLTSRFWVVPGNTLAESLGVTACRLPGVDRSTLRDFLNENGEVRPLGLVIDPRVAISIVPVEKRGAYARADALERFPDANGVMAASRPGLSRDGTEALVYVEIVGVEGWFVALRAQAGEWRVVLASMAWIS